MNRKLTMILCFALLSMIYVASAATAQVTADQVAATPLSTAFTYQGYLTDGNRPADGIFDLRFILYDAEMGGAQVGATVTEEDVTIATGIFSVPLDFGAVFTGNAVWLEVAVRPGASTGIYTILSPRQPLTASPLALFSKVAPWSGISGVPAGFADNVDNNTTYLAGNGLTLIGNEFSANFDGTWGGLSGVPAGFADNVDNDYSPHNHLGETWTGSENPLEITGLFTTTATISLTNSTGIGLWSTYGNKLDVPGWWSPGLLGDSNVGNGIIGVTSADTGVGVIGQSNNYGWGIYGVTYGGGYAAGFNGNVTVTGDLFVSGAKAFRIDYPQDPSNRYLLHYSVESPQVQNQYNGTVILDANGEAVVLLPNYFSTINTGPYSYQLTAIGAPSPNLYIAKEVVGNQFMIAGGTPEMHVSWLLYAMRNDNWLRDHPHSDIVDKPNMERGTYLYPQGYDLDASLQLGIQTGQLASQPWQQDIPNPSYNSAEGMNPAYSP